MPSNIDFVEYVDSDDDVTESTPSEHSVTISEFLEQHLPSAPAHAENGLEENKVALRDDRLLSAAERSKMVLDAITREYEQLVEENILELRVENDSLPLTSSRLGKYKTQKIKNQKK